MSPDELRASLSLAAVFALRLFGMFIILPVFALFAQGRPGWSLTLVGVALGIYGLVQGVLQIPFGWLSDRVGRKPIIYGGLVLMVAGSFLCAAAESPWAMIAGRALQGAGAISAAVLALAADLTRESQRTKTMAIIGSTIGAAFALSFVAAPFLSRAVGVPGIFALTGVLALAAMAVVRFVVPDAPAEARAASAPSFLAVLRDRELARLNVGIFVLHAVLMAMFVVIPVSLVQAGLPAAGHWWVYLSTVIAGFLLMLPGVVGRAALHEKPVFLAAIAVVSAALALLAFGLGSLAGIVAALVIFFTGFNVLEAKLPALVSRTAPREARGAATGVYSSVQFLGTFAGAAAGGALAQHAGFVAVLATCLMAMLAWLAVAWNMNDLLPRASPAAGN
jgi:predicted MFS family arabinose efflux permease